MKEMCSSLPISCNSGRSSSQLLATAARRPGGSIAPGRSVIISTWAPPSSSSWLQAVPTTNCIAFGRGRRGTSRLSSSCALTREHPHSRFEELQIPAPEVAASRIGCCSSIKQKPGGLVLVSGVRSGDCGFSLSRRGCGAESHCYHCQGVRLLGSHGGRRTGEGRWGLPALCYTGGGGSGERRISSRACGRIAVNSSSRVCGWSGGKRRSGKAGWMELFKPQLMDTLPFRFLSEYHTTPPRAVKDSISPICFFGFGQQKPVVEVVQAGDPVLHEPAAEVLQEEIGSARIERIINDMVATMRNAPGVGLAAPQIGVQLQIIVLEDTKELMSYSSPEECDAQQRFPFDLLVIINPKLKSKSGSGSAVFFEGCLSVEGYRALVERDLEVEVNGLGRDGRPIHVEASGWQARILQHECDHLAGNLYVDKMVPRTIRTKNNLRLPLAAGCPKPGVCKQPIKSLK